MREYHCSYCGKKVNKIQREHVIPSCLYPSSQRLSRVQRITIPACNECNNGWSDDEAHFRNILVLAGEQPNWAREKLWEKILRSFDEVDGLKRKRDVISCIKSIESNKGNIDMVFPGEQERIKRVVKKIIRGLSHYHKIMSAVAEDRVWVDVLKYKVPERFILEMTSNHRGKDIVEYKYSVLNEDNINSAWLITFFESVTFIGYVIDNE